jgi:hypothetical protein
LDGAVADGGGPPVSILKTTCVRWHRRQGGAKAGKVGNLGLTDAEEDAIFAFVRTLSDGYQPPAK